MIFGFFRFHPDGASKGTVIQDMANCNAKKDEASLRCMISDPLVPTSRWNRDRRESLCN